VIARKNAAKNINTANAANLARRRKTNFIFISIK